MILLILALGFVALSLVVLLRALARRIAARRRAKDLHAWQDAYERAGGSVLKFPGYDPAQQAKAVSQVRAMERRQLQSLKAKARPATPKVVSIASRKAAR